MTTTLVFGDYGPEVSKLQSNLLLHGFNPGKLDGDFGPGTDAALRGFQRSTGLVPDGVVGDLTLTALAATPVLPRNAPTVFPPTPLPPSRATTVVNGSDLFRTVRTASLMIPAAPLSNINRYLPSIVAALDEDDIGDAPMFCAAIGTIAAETASFRPIDEGESRYNTSPSGHPFDLYDNRRDLGNRGYPDGSNGKGRGFVQLTGMDNYRWADNELGLAGALVAQPWLANDAEIAARVLARFLKRVEKPMRVALADHDLARARKLVNGGSHGLDAFSAAYTTGSKLAVRYAT